MDSANSSSEAISANASTNNTTTNNNNNHTSTAAGGGRTKGRSRTGCVKYESYAAYTRTGLGSKDDRKVTTVDRVTYGMVGATCMKGWRMNMEDAHFVMSGVDLGPTLGIADIVGVFDGHVSDATAKYCANVFPIVLLEELCGVVDGGASVDAALTATFIRVDKEHYASSTPPPNSGATALVAVITSENIIVANAGDCRAVLYRQASSLPMSCDHKPTVPEEAARIAASHKYTVQGGRVGGKLSVSRAIGDYLFKDVEGISWELQPVTCVPEIRWVARSPTDEVLVLGCDGVWEEEPGAAANKKENFLGSCLRAVDPTSEDSMRGELERLLQQFVAPSIPSPIGCDNMTLVAVFFPRDAKR